MPGGAGVLQLGSEAQVEALREDPSVRAGGLSLSEVRSHERGVLVLVDREPDDTL